MGLTLTAFSKGTTKLPSVSTTVIMSSVSHVVRTLRAILNLFSSFKSVLEREICRTGPSSERTVPEVSIYHTPPASDMLAWFCSTMPGNCREEALTVSVK